ncbi:MAG TPA: response regulator transcription factor [Sphingobacteriaceae bacterium]
MKAIAIDDEILALDIIRSHASKVPFMDLKAEFTDAFKALEYLQKENIDLLFLDIKMPDISGIEFFNSLSKKPLLIFTTAYADHAVTSFEMDAVDYLLKPFSLSRFLKACNKAFELYNFRNSSEMPDHIFLKTGFEQQKVLFDEILFVEATGNYVTFALEQEKNLVSRSTFAEAISVLPADRFLRVHRSFVVAADKIDKLERHQLTVRKNKIPLGEAYRHNVDLVIKR